MAPLRRAERARRLPGPRAQRRRRDRREHDLLRQPGRHARHARLADAQGLAAPRLADARAELLQVARALVARRPADLREPARRQRGALHGVSVQEELLQRDGRRAAPGQAHPRAPGLHRRPERRPRQGLVPDRQGSLRGAPRGQRGQARGHPRHRGVEAVRLRRLQRPAGVHRRADRPAARRGLRARRARHGAGQQVRQRARRRRGRHGLDRGRGQRRQPRRDRPLLGDGPVRGPAQPRQGAADRARRRPTATPCWAMRSPSCSGRARRRSTARRRTATRAACPGSASTSCGG